MYSKTIQQAYELLSKSGLYPPQLLYKYVQAEIIVAEDLSFLAEDVAAKALNYLSRNFPEYVWKVVEIAKGRFEFSVTKKDEQVLTDLEKETDQIARFELLVQLHEKAAREIRGLLFLNSLEQPEARELEKTSLAGIIETQRQITKLIFDK